MNPPIKGRRPLAMTAISFAVLAAIGAAGWLGLHSQAVKADAPAAASLAIPVSAALLARQDVTTWENFSGRLEAVERVELRSRVAGAIRAVHFREGALVKAGDLLVSIDPAPYQAEVDRTAAQVAAAQSQLVFARSEQERANRMLADHAIAQRDADERNNAARAADASLKAAQAALQTARLNLGYTAIRAPVAGRVGKLLVTTGNLVSAGPDSPVLTTLVSVNPVYASFDADEETVSKALAELPDAGGARARLADIPLQVSTSTAQTFAAKLQLVDNQVDGKSGTVKLRATVDNRDGVLIPGQFVRIRLGQAKRHPALLLNEQAIGTDQDKRYVMVIDKDSKARYRQVQLGASVDGLRIVTAGLQAGERVIVDGLQKVQPGAPVAPHMVPMQSPATAAANS